MIVPYTVQIKKYWVSKKYFTDFCLLIEEVKTLKP